MKRRKSTSKKKKDAKIVEMKIWTQTFKRDAPICVWNRRLTIDQIKAEPGRGSKEEKKRLAERCRTNKAAGSDGSSGLSSKGRKRKEKRKKVKAPSDKWEKARAWSCRRKRKRRKARKTREMKKMWKKKAAIRKRCSFGLPEVKKTAVEGKKTERMAEMKKRTELKTATRHKRKANRAMERWKAGSKVRKDEQRNRNRNVNQNTHTQSKANGQKATSDRMGKKAANEIGWKNKELKLKLGCAFNWDCRGPGQECKNLSTDEQDETR